jgi:hypothetical protein
MHARDKRGKKGQQRRTTQGPRKKDLSTRFGSNQRFDAIEDLLRGRGFFGAEISSHPLHLIRED